MEIANATATPACYFIDGTQAFKVELTLVNGTIITINRIGNPGRYETPEQFVERRFPKGMDVWYLMPSINGLV